MTVLIPEDEIRKRVDLVARQIAQAYAGQPLTIVGVLTGCLVFLADLIRRLDLPLRIALVQASSYRGKATTAGDLHVQDELLPDLKSCGAATKNCGRLAFRAIATGIANTPPLPRYWPLR